MDRSWVHGRLFTREYISGVKNFMSFIQRKFCEDDEILCPCSRCLNQKSWHQGLVEKHLLVHHGENFDVDVIENPDDVHDHANDSLMHGIDVEDENYDNDHFEGMLRDLQSTKE
ncbi:hypothetical protein U9M48_028323 [Paspalum notatum var. saurae]|uniref:Transposase-associated domain-containing protein n=1 Tax=Paspalum notatum var. saurae TaxID=547442 RepID=A0AAQ3U0Y0_PASNO